MVIFIQEGSIGTVFKLSSGKVIEIKVGEGGGVYNNDIEDEDFEAMMKEYGSYIEPRIKTDENPLGCFIIKKPVVEEVIEEKPVKVEKKKKGKK